MSDMPLVIKKTQHNWRIPPCAVEEVTETNQVFLALFHGMEVNM
jgi:hypothetical protein